MGSIKKRIVLIVVLIMSITIISLYLSYKNNLFNKEEYIQKVLKTEAYSYLPEEAKEYIKKVYEETGNIILTEKNKKVNVPYLNPKYVEYLTYMNIFDEEKDIESENRYNFIPNEAIVDYVNSNYKTLNSDEIPSSYNLNNVNGKDFVTPIKNQKSSGLCWAFATNSQVESYLLVKNNKSYQDNVSKIFSERQLDYATAINGAKEYDNVKYGNRLLIDGGGNFYHATDIMKDGLGLVDSSWKSFDDTDYSKMELNEIYNYENSNYEVNNAVYATYIDFNEASNEEKTNYLNIIKELIMNNGGAFVGTQGPEYSCSALNSLDNNESYIIREDEYCTANANHAMHIIGWDDNYNYKYCKANNKHSSYDSNCLESNTITGEGAWILKNSWGTEKPYVDYVYLAYDSLNSSISLITDISENSNKKWNNSYEENIKTNDFIIKKHNEYVIRSLNIENTIDNNEILSKIKFFIPIQYDKYHLLYSSSNDLNNLEVISTIDGGLPGIYTFDISNKNINALSGKFYLAIEAEQYIDDLIEIMKSVEVDFYTINNNVTITTKNSTYKNTYNTKNTDNYKLYVYSDTLGLDSNEVVDYELYDLNGNNLSSNISYTNNLVADNKVRAILSISSSLEVGEYILKTKYKNDIKSESKIYLREIKALEGKGTSSEPYVITTPDELAMINDNLSAYYVLGNHIDMTEATQKENGIFYNEGRGWIPIGGYDELPFGGSLDGRGYTIKGLYKNDSKYNGGLFFEIGVTNKTNINIQNINFEDCYIHSYATYNEGNPNYTSNEGLLAYKISDLYKQKMMDYYLKDTIISVNISNISIKDSYISGYTISGGLFAVADVTKNNSININNIYFDSEIKSSEDNKNLKAGLIGIAKVNNSYENNANIRISDVLNIGKIYTDTSLDTDYYSGSLIGVSYGKVDLNNIISNVTLVNEASTNSNINYGSLMGAMLITNNHTGISTLNNIYYTNPYNYILYSNNSYTSNNIINKKFLELKDNNLITNWTNWEIKTIDEIDRIPMLKFVDFDYTSIEKIKLGKNEEINLYDLITPNKEIAKNIEYKINDTSIATIDDNGLIKGINTGKTTISIVSYYDGYENDLEIEVGEGKKKIIFNSNGGSEVIPIEEYANTDIVEPTAPTKNHYKFDGWYTDNETFLNKYVFDKMPEEDITLYAKWIPNEYTIEFNSNGGKGTMNNQIYTYKVEQKINVNSFTKEGYHFKNWNTKKDGTGKTYSDNQLISIDNNIILYAIWQEEFGYKINEYEIDDNNNYIDSIDINTTVEDFMKKIELEKGFSVDVDAKQVNGKKVLYTGGKTKIYKNGELYIEYTNIIRGDVNGNASIDIIDYIRIMKDIMGVTKLNSVYKIAADVNNNQKIDIIDYIRIMKMIMEEN